MVKWDNRLQVCPHYRHSFTLLRIYREELMTPDEESAYTEDDIWNQKLEDIQRFQANSNSEITYE